MPVAQLSAMINELPARIQGAGGDLARLALDSKLVDGLKTQDEFEAMLAKAGAWDQDEHSYRQIGMYPYLLQRRAGRGGLLDRHGEPVQSLRIDMTVRRLPWVELKDISPALPGAILQAEDQRFYQHDGVDWSAAAKAAWKAKAQATVDNAHMRYFIVHLHRLLDPEV